MTPAVWGDIGALALAVASLITWYIHSHTGDHSSNSRNGDHQ